VSEQPPMGLSDDSGVHYEDVTCRKPKFGWADPIRLRSLLASVESQTNLGIFSGVAPSVVSRIAYGLTTAVRLALAPSKAIV